MEAEFEKIKKAFEANDISAFDEACIAALKAHSEDFGKEGRIIRQLLDVVTQLFQ